MRKWMRWAGWAFFLVAAIVFVKRSLLGSQLFWDFPIIYTSSKAWLLGRNPYALDAVLPLWPPDAVTCVKYTPDVFLPVATPTSLIALASVAWMSPPAAVFAWIAGSLALLCGAVVAAGAMAGLKWENAVTGWFGGLILLSSPLEISFMAGQPAIAAMALLVLGAFAAMRESYILAGIFFAIGSCLKLQLGLPLVALFFFIPGKRRVGVTASLILCAVLAILLVKIQIDHINSLQGWFANIRSVAQPGGMDDFGLDNSERYHMLNFQLLFAAMFRNRTLVDLMSLGISLALAAILLFRMTQSSDKAIEKRAGIITPTPGRGRLDILRCLAAAAPLCLLPVYHRYYDAVMLIFTLAWVVRESVRPRPAPALAAGAILFFCFMTPMSIAPRLAEHLPVSANSMVNLFLIPFRVWALAALTLIVLFDDKPGTVKRSPTNRARTFLAGCFPHQCNLGEFIIAAKIRAPALGLFRTGVLVAREPAPIIPSPQSTAGANTFYFPFSQGIGMIRSHITQRYGQRNRHETPHRVYAH